MQLARFLVEAVVLGKQSPNRLVREHPISRSCSTNSSPATGATDPLA
jgi:hypothetical protein